VAVVLRDADRVRERVSFRGCKRQKRTSGQTFV
jgi:hypothetical protein